MRPVLALTLLSALACGGPTNVGSPYHEDLLPTEEKVRINLPVDGAAAKGDEDGEFARYYVVTRQVTEHVNGLIGFVLGTVGYVVTLEPQWSDADARTAVWGPYSDSGLDPVETGLWVREEDDGSYAWVIFQVERGGSVEEDAIPIVTGIVDAGATTEVASGQFVIDFTTAASLDPAVALTGTFAVEYAYDTEGVAAVAWGEGYGAKGGALVDAVYAYDQTYDGAGEMDLAWLEDVNATGTDEILAMRTRWEASGDGRSDAVVTGGDLGADAHYASECWGGDFATAYWADTVGLYEPAGDVSACAFAEQELPTEASFTLAE
ncbi:MAG: hypothetical protein ACK4YP_23985 [Myxococcota bacterium]